MYIKLSEEFLFPLLARNEHEELVELFVLLHCYITSYRQQLRGGSWTFPLNRLRVWSIEGMMSWPTYYLHHMSQNVAFDERGGHSCRRKLEYVTTLFPHAQWILTFSACNGAPIHLCSECCHYWLAQGNIIIADTHFTVPFKEFRWACQAWKRFKLRLPVLKWLCWS